MSSAPDASSSLEAGVVDFHNHLIPGVDDGAATIDESRDALVEMVGQSIRTIVTTPHISGSVLSAGKAGPYLDHVDSQWKYLQSVAADAFPGLRLERGCELLLDSPRIELADPRLRLAGSNFVLVEFPWNGLPPNSAEALFEIKMGGYSPIVAHPERYRYMDTAMALALAWQRAGAYLQVNTGSLVGTYGQRARDLAWRSLELGLADYLCSDFHARGKCSSLDARRALTELGSVEIAGCLTQVNPQRILQNLEPLPTAPLTPGQLSWWKRLIARLR